MKISSLTIVESLKGMLLRFPALVDCLQNKNFNFLSLLENWMREAETILINNQIAECSEIAGLRSKIIAPLFAGQHGRSNKKMQLQIASGLLYEIQKTIISVLKRYEIKVDGARDLLINLLSILKQSGAIKYSDSIDFQSFINHIWNMFSTHEQLKPGTVKILTLISQIDALRIIAEEINLEEWR